MNQLIFSKASEISKILSPENILRLEANGNYTILVTNELSQYAVCKRLSTIQRKFYSDTLISVNRSNMINLKFCREIIKAGMHYIFVMLDGAKIKSSRRKFYEIKPLI
jgi:DNA-binding LytR/AlgR family response regulator